MLKDYGFSQCMYRERSECDWKYPYQAIVFDYQENERRVVLREVIKKCGKFTEEQLCSAGKRSEQHGRSNPPLKYVATRYRLVVIPSSYGRLWQEVWHAHQYRPGGRPTLEPHHSGLQVNANRIRCWELGSESRPTSSAFLGQRECPQLAESPLMQRNTIAHGSHQADRQFTTLYR